MNAFRHSRRAWACALWDACGLPQRRLGAFVLAFVTVFGASAQTAPGTYWVKFTDKASTPYSISAPEAFLSQRAIERRQRQGIAIDELDLPVDPAYVNALLTAGQFELINRHKWFNAVTIRSTDTLALDTIAQLPFVHEVRCVHDDHVRAAMHEAKLEPELSPIAKRTYDETYGASLDQIALVNGHLLHEFGRARGEGMLIGVLDSGFENADSLAAFGDLRARGGIVLARDFVQPGHDVFASHWHGRSVLSVMAGHLPGKLLGTAPNANYVLLRTEESGSEYVVEEDNWVSGAEVADSIGCDVLNTSLGYALFDDSTQNHTYADLDGQTTRISIAAGIAASRGMIVCNSAGNSGALPWHYISAPADANGILAMGAVNSDAVIAPFSAFGPSADGRVKPDVCAVGWGTIGLGADGNDIASINGTSFSSPLLAGLAACLWQLHPDKSAQEISDAIRRSADHYRSPNDLFGYGIPDFWRAHVLLDGVDITGLQGAAFFNVFPVPFDDHFDIELYTGSSSSLTIELCDALGRSIWNQLTPVQPNNFERLRVEAPSLFNLPNGAYVLRASLGGHAEWVGPVIKAE